MRLTTLVLLCILFPLIQSFCQLAPVIEISRDDHVASLEIDFDGYNGAQLWSVGEDGTDPIGYLVKWWLDASEIDNVVTNCGCQTDNMIGSQTIPTASDPMKMVTSNAVVQLQPIANNVLYHVSVQKLNSFGELIGPETTSSFMGGDPTRVNHLRANMTFFDDFNLPMGPADERKWNNAMTTQTDPRFNLFFINHQCHTHTLAGTLNGAAGDKAQVAQRARKPILIDSVEERQIVFDMDGIFSPRSVWYLDLNPIKTDLSDHMSFFDLDGDIGLPADILRLRAQGNDFSVHLVDNQGAILNVAETELDDHGLRLSTNVRRSFDVRLNTAGIKIYVDSVLIIDQTFDVGTFKAGVYDVLWHVVGYNTSKDDNPYFLSHWDNFGFDGPNIEPYVIHNYKTRIDSTDHQQANKFFDLYPTFNVQVPDDIRPLSPGTSNEVWLVFTYMQNNWSYFNVEPGDFLLFNGDTVLLPDPINNSYPLNPDLVGPLGSIMTNRVYLGEAFHNGVSPLQIGLNEIQFFCGNTGIMNLHVEVMIPESATAPPYTQPAQIHPFPMHASLPKLGTSANIVDIDDQELSYISSSEINGPSISGEVPIEFLIGNDSWANWAPHLLHRPARTAELWSVGSTKGIEYFKIYIKPITDSLGKGILVDSINTSKDAAAPQIRYTYSFDSRDYENGEYYIFVQAMSPTGVESHPAYGGHGFLWDASEFSGAYLPVKVNIDNVIPNKFVFNGSVNSQWLDGMNWDTGFPPPYNYKGNIEINANCMVPKGYLVRLGLGGEMLLSEGVILELE
ncbi:MAG: hypothetical protein AAGK97_00550 [Bacteroidota bacterium]